MSPPSEGMSRLAWSASKVWAGWGAYLVVEKRNKGDVLRKARAEGSEAKARAPTSDFAMICDWMRGRR
jgi:hypothetical protein